MSQSDVVSAHLLMWISAESDALQAVTQQECPADARKTAAHMLEI